MILEEGEPTDAQQKQRRSNNALKRQSPAAAAIAKREKEMYDHATLVATARYGGFVL